MFPEMHWSTDMDVNKKITNRQSGTDLTRKIDIESVIQIYTFKFLMLNLTHILPFL